MPCRCFFCPPLVHFLKIILGHAAHQAEVFSANTLQGDSQKHHLMAVKLRKVVFPIDTTKKEIVFFV